MGEFYRPIHLSAWKGNSANFALPKCSEVPQFGKLGALPLPLARESSVDHMINKVIVEPLSLALNALSPETQPLGYGAAPLVFCCARDDHPIQVEFKKG